MFANFVDLLRQGGLTIWFLIGLSVLALATIIERSWFWFSLLTKEKEILNQVISSISRQDWVSAMEVARCNLSRPIGRFLYAPLKLANPDPEVFRLALEASADEELVTMRRGDKILEAVIALSPLLGLLGTVLGLIKSLGNIRLGDLGTSSTAGVSVGIGQALFSTAVGLIIAIVSLAFYRLFQGLVFYQAKLLQRAGNDLELLYRQAWSQTGGNLLPGALTTAGLRESKRGSDEGKSKGKSKDAGDADSTSSTPSEDGKTRGGFTKP